MMPEPIDCPDPGPNWKSHELPENSKRAGPMQMTWGMAAPEAAEWRKEVRAPRASHDCFDEDGSCRFS